MIRNYPSAVILSLITWFLTNALGALLVSTMHAVGLRFLAIFAIAMLFSSPAVLVLIACWHRLAGLRRFKTRLVFAITRSAYASAPIMVIFVAFLLKFPNIVYFIPHAPSSVTGYFFLLFPFVLAGPIAFLLVGHLHRVVTHVAAEHFNQATNKFDGI